MGGGWWWWVATNFNVSIRQGSKLWTFRLKGHSLPILAWPLPELHKRILFLLPGSRVQSMILNQSEVISVMCYGWQYLQTIYWVCTLSTVLACWGLPAWALQQYRSQAPPSTCSNTHSAHACCSANFSIYSFCGPCDMIPAPTLVDDTFGSHLQV